MSSRNQKFYFIPVGQETNPNYQADLDISLAYVSGTTKFLGAVTGVSTLNVSGGAFLQGSTTVLSNLNVSGVVTIGTAPTDLTTALTVNNQMKFIEYGTTNVSTTSVSSITENTTTSQTSRYMGSISLPAGFVDGSVISVVMTGTRGPGYGYIEGGSYIQDTTDTIRLIQLVYGDAGRSGIATITGTVTTPITASMFPLKAYKYSAYPGWSVSSMTLDVTITYNIASTGIRSSFQQIASQGSYALVDNINSTPRLFIDQWGEVGIGGVTAPSTFLHVAGQYQDAIAHFQANTNTGVNDAGIILGSISGVTPFIGDNASTASAGLTFRTNNVERMRIDSTGKLGLGVSAPLANMHISGSSLFNGPMTGYSTLNISGVTSLMGNVGIGTTTPGVKLQVDGNVCINRSKLTFSHSPNDFNHAIFNNNNNLDGEGSIDGLKVNAYSCFWVRMGTANGAVPTTGMYINSSGQMGIGTTNTEGNMLKVDGGNSASGISLGNFDTTGIKYIGITPITGMPSNLGTNSGFSGITFGAPNPGSSTSGYLAFHTHHHGVASAERMRIDRSGNVGIGTSAPVTTLHVNGNSYVSGAATVGSTLNVLSTGYFGGNLGIGTTSPGQPLSIQMAPSSEGGAGAIVLQDTSAINRLRIGFNSNYSWIQSHNSQNLVINSVGNNVGIGMTNPSALLHVNGTSIVTGAMTAGSTLRVIGTTTVPELQMSGITSGPAGLNTESTNILNMNLNFRGGANTSNVGASFRIDGRNADTTPLYQWLYREAGSSSEDAIMTLNSDGNLALGTNTSGSAPTMLYVSGTSAFNSNTTVNSTLYVGDAMTANSTLSVNGNLDVLSSPVAYTFSAGTVGVATDGGGGGAGGIIVQNNGVAITPNTVATDGTNGSSSDGGSAGTGFGAGGGGSGTSSSGSTTSVAGEWMQFDLGSAKVIQTYGLGNWGMDKEIGSWTLAGSTDNSTWYTIDTRVQVTPAHYAFTTYTSAGAQAANSYRYIRLIVQGLKQQPYYYGSTLQFTFYLRDSANNFLQTSPSNTATYSTNLGNGTGYFYMSSSTSDTYPNSPGAGPSQPGYYYGTNDTYTGSVTTSITTPIVPVSVPGAWCQFDFGTAKNLGSYYLQNYNSSYMTHWTIVGSNDNSTWYLIDKIEGGVNLQSGYSRTVPSAYSAFTYRYMRWIVQRTTDTNYIFNHIAAWRDTSNNILTATTPGYVIYSSGAGDKINTDNSNTIYLNGSNINWMHSGNYGSGIYSGPTTTDVLDPTVGGGSSSETPGVGANGFVYINIDGTEYFTQDDDTYTMPSTGTAKIMIMGGGGNGGSSDTNSGGGAGYIQTYEVAVTSGDVASITIGSSSTNTSVVIGATTYSANAGADGGAYGGDGSSSGGNIGSNGMNSGNTDTNTTSQGNSVFTSFINFVQGTTVLSASTAGVTASSLLLTGSLNTSGNITGLSNLNISGTTSLMGNVAINNSTASTNLTIYTTGEGFRQTDNNVILDIFTGTGGASTSAEIGTASNHPLGFYTNNNPAQMVLDTSGNLGIATTTPAAKLHVNGATILGGAITTTSTLTVANAVTALSTVNISGRTVISGSVGIGTNPVSSALHINNNVLRMGTIYEQLNVYYPEQIQWGNIGGMGYSNITAGINSIGGPYGCGGILNLTTRLGNNTTYNGIYINNGNVGVGISSPSTMFHVNGNSLLQGAASITSTLNVNSTFSVGTGDNTLLFTPGSIFAGHGTGIVSQANAMWIDLPGTGTISLSDNIILNAGNFGINTLVPNFPLHVSGTSYFNGNMGIGTSSPNAILHVSGNAIIQTAATVGSTLNVSGATTINGAMTANSSLNVVGSLRVNNIYPYADTITSGSTLNETINIVGHYINIGNANSVINILGTTTSVFTNEIMLEDPLIIVNSKSSSIYNLSGNDAGIQIDAISSVGYIKTTSDGTKFAVKAPQSTDIGYIVTKDNSDNLVITGTSIMKGASTHLSTLNISGTAIINNNLAVGRSSARYPADIVGPVNYPLTGAAAQMIVSDSVGSGMMMLGLGTNGTNNYAAIQSSLSGTGAMPISINPSGGNVSIGMTAGSSILQVNQAYSASSTLLEGPEVTLSTTNAVSTLWKLGAVTGYVAAGAANDTSNYPGGLLFKTKVQDGSNTSALVSRMALDSRGYLGVGTLAPSTMLHVSGASTLNGPVTVTSTLNVSGNTVLAGTLLLNNNPVMVHKELAAAPANPNLGDEWYNTSTSVLYKYINSQWVAAPVATPSLVSYRNFTGSESIINYYNQIWFSWTAPVACNIASLTIQASGGINNGGFIGVNIWLNGNLVFSQAYNGITSVTDNVISMSWSSTRLEAGQVFSIQWSTFEAGRYMQVRSNATSTLPVIFTYTSNTGYVNMFGLSVTGTSLLQSATTAVTTLNVSGASVFNSSINMPNQSASSVLVIDSNKNVVSSNISTTTLSYLDATSSIQTQLNSMSTNASSGAQTITGLKTYQSTTNNTPNIIFSGTALNNSVDNNYGIGMELYNNTAGNRQLALIDSAISRSGTAYSVLRFGVGYNVGNPFIDAVSNDGNTTHRQLSLGNSGGGVTMNGNVGIGTASPSYTLDVNGSIRSQSSAYIGNGSGGVGLNLWDIPTAAWQMTTGDYNLSFNNGTINGSLTNRMTLTSTGNVGIGTASPSALLYLNSSTADRTTSLVVNTMRAGVQLSSTGSGGGNFNIWSTLTGEVPGAGALAFFDNTNTSFRMVIGSSGNVGIANPTPQFKLHVGTDANPGTVATGTLRLQPNYNGAGQYGFNISAVDNGVDGHNMVFTSRAGPTDAFYEVARLTNSGLMGIGTTAPAARLHVSGNTIISNGATIMSSLNVSGSTNITNGATVVSTLNVSGNTVITGTLTVNNYPLVVHKELGTSPSGPNLGDEHYNTSTSMLSKYMAGSWYTLPFIKGKLYSFSAGAGGAAGTVSGGATYSGGGGAGGVVVQNNGVTVTPTTVASVGTGGTTGNGGSGGVGFGAGGGGSGTTSGSTTTISGDWYQVQYPASFILTSYQIGSRYDLNSSAGQNRTAKNFSVLGSTDGTNWNLIDTRTNQNAWYNGSLNSFTVSNNTTAYSYYRIIATQLNPEPYPIWEIGNLNLFAGASMWPPVQLANSTWTTGATTSTGTLTGQSYGNGSYIISSSIITNPSVNVYYMHAQILGNTTPSTSSSTQPFIAGNMSYNTNGDYTGSNSVSVPVVLAGGVGANGFVYLFSDYEEYFTQATGTYTVNFPGVFKVLVMGKGGSGGSGSSRGGGGAGYIQAYKVELIKGTVVSVTLGANNTTAVINNITYTADAGASGSTNASGGAGSSSGGGSNTAPSGATSGFSGGNSNTNTTSQGTAVFNTLSTTVMTSAMTTNYLGQIGIGTPAPAATLHVSGTSIISGASTIGSSLFVGSALTTTSSLNVSGNTTMNGPITALSSINISGNTMIGGNMNISGTSSLMGNVAINNSTAQTALTVTASGVGFRQTDNSVSLDIYTGNDGTLTAGKVGTSTNHPLAFYTNNSNAQMVLATSGNFGIANSAPSYKLDVSGDIRASGSMIVGSSGTYVPGAIFSDNNWGMLFRAKTAAPTTAEFLFSNSADTHRMVISTAGNMGVGTDTPNSYYRIHAVQSSNDCLITAECTNSTQYAYFCAKANGTVGYFGQTNTGNSFIMNGSNTVMTFSSGANVGIGTTAPTSKLHLHSTSIGPDQFTLTNSSGMQLAVWGSASVLAIDTYNTITATRPPLSLNQSGGRVGIGMVSPDSILHVEGSSAGSNGGGSGSIVHIKQNTGWTGAQPWALYVEGYSYLNGFRVNAADDQRSLYKVSAGGQMGFATNGATPITFSINDASEIMRIAGNGYVGIGTGSPSTMLHVNGASTLGGATTVTSTLYVSGATTTGSSLNVAGAFTAAGTSLLAGATLTSGLYIPNGDGASNVTVLSLRNNSGYGIYATTTGINSRGNTVDFLGSDYNFGGITTRTVMTLRPEGSVGIGMNSLPSATFDVNGTSLLRGATTSNSTLFVGGAMTAASTMNIVGATVVSGAVSANSTLNVASTANLNGGVNIGNSSTGNIFPLNVGGTMESYSMTSSAKNQYFNSGTLMVIMPPYGGSNTTVASNAAALIDFGNFSTTDGNTNAYFGAVGGATGTSNLSSHLVFGRRSGVTSWTETMRIDTIGRVGIATTTPSDTLHVSGTAKINGSMTALSTLNVSGATIINGAMTTASTLNVSGTTSIMGKLGVGIAAPTSTMQIHSALVSGTTGLWEASDLRFTYNAGSGNMWDLGRISGYIAANTNNDTANWPGGLLFQTKTPGTIGSLATTKMVIDSNGNVGIGNTAPQALLHVSGTSIIGGAMTAASTLNVVGQTIINGNVGIGTSAPSYKLHVANAGDSVIMTECTNSFSYGYVVLKSNGTSTSLVQRNTGNFNITNGANSIMEIVSGTGNVGFGTTTPSASFHVAGTSIMGGAMTTGSTLNVTGALTAASTSILSGATTVLSTFNVSGTSSFQGTVSVVNSNGPLFGLSDTISGSWFGQSNTTSNGWLTGLVQGDMFIRAANNLALGVNNTNGIPALRINSNGNVGIGTNSVSALLHVSGTSIIGGAMTAASTLNVASSLNVSGTTSIMGNIGIGTTTPASMLHLAKSVTADNDTSSMITFQNTNANYFDWMIGPQVLSNQALFSIRGGNDSYTALSNFVNINGSGNVGLGTTTPNALLHVSGTSIIGGAMTAGSTLNVVGAVSISGTTSIMGNLGIGTITPSYALDVNGSMKINNTLYVQNETTDIDNRYDINTFMKPLTSYFSTGSSVSTLTYTTDASSPVGTEIIQASNYMWVNGPLMRLDKTKNYEVEMWIRRTAAGTAGTFYMVVANFDSAKANIAGADGAQWHYPVLGKPQTEYVLNTWYNHRFVVGPYGGARDHASNARYISLGFIVNYTTGTDTFQFTGFKIKPITRYNNDALTITNSGNVGLSTTAPSASLHVSGTSIISGAMTAASSLNVVGAMNISSLNASALTSTTTLNVSGNTVIMGTASVGTATAKGLVQIYNPSTTSQFNLTLTGTEYYVPGSNTSTDGIGLTVGVNRSNNRQLWVMDTALAANTTNTAFRILPSLGLIDAISTDGTVYKTFGIGSSAGVIINGNSTAASSLNISGTTVMNAPVTTSSTLNVAGALTAASTSVLVGATSVNSTLNVAGAVTNASTLNVIGGTTIGGALNVTTNIQNAGLTVANTYNSSTGTISLHTTAGAGNYIIDGTANAGAVIANNDLYLNRTTGLYTALMVKGGTGYVGIATSNPSANLHVNGTSIIAGAMTVGSTLNVSGTSTLNSAIISGPVSTSSTLYVGNNMTVTGSSLLTGTATAASSLNVIGNLRVNNIYPYADTITGASTLNETINIIGHYINIGNNNSVINIQGTTTSVFTNEIIVEDPLIVVNSKSSGVYNTLGNDAGIQIDAISSTGYLKTTADGTKFAVKAPQSTDIGYIVTKDNSDNLTITGTTTMKSATTVVSTLNVSSTTMLLGAVTTGSSLNVVGQVTTSQLNSNTISSLAGSGLGIYAASNPMSFYVNSVNGMNLTSNGYLGIGTSSPANPLHVYNTTSGLGITVDAPAAATTQFQANSAGTQAWSIYRQANTTNLGIYMTTAAVNAMTILGSNGNIGIGMNAPTAMLHVTGTSILNGASTHGSTLNIVGNTVTMGNLGIGTTNPTALLHLYGATNPGVYLTSSAGNANLGIATAGGNYASNAVTGDTILRNESSSYRLLLGAGTGNAPVIITSSGMGIGVAPTAMMHISGTTIMNSAATASSTLNVAGAVSMASTLNVTGTTSIMGNMGIGTTAPTHSLHIAKGNDSLRIGATGFAGTAADITTYGLERSRNQIIFSTYRDVLPDKIGAKIIGINKQTYIDWPATRQAIQSTDLAFFTVPPNAANYDDTVERFRIMDTGNVGIGISGPTALLHVSGTSIMGGAMTTGSTLNVVGAVSMASTLNVSGTTSMMGKLGVGTINPVGALTVALGDAGSNIGQGNWNANYLLVTNDTTGSNAASGMGFSYSSTKGGVISAAVPGSVFTNINYIANAHFISCGGSNTQVLTVASNGNVGIGTTGPSTLLHVAGTGLVTGAMTAASTLNVSGTTIFNSNVAIGATSGSFPLVVNSGADMANDNISWKNNTYELGRLGFSGSNAGWMGLFSSGTVTTVLRANGISTFNGGSVGVGVTTASALLHVSGTSIMGGAMTAGSTLNVTGNMGIGTMTPTAKLEINGLTIVKTTADWSLAKVIATSGSFAAAYVSTPYGTLSSSNPEWFIGHRHSAQGPLSIWNYDGTNHNSNNVTITTAGNVGIGTTTPGALLHVSGTTIISNAMTAGSTLNIAGALTAASTSIMSGAMTTNSTINVSGTATFNNNINIGTSSGAVSLNMGITAEQYNMTSSAKSLYLNSGTVIALTTNTTSAVTNNSALLIDLHNYSSSIGHTNAYIGSVNGSTSNGASHLVFGRRTGVTSWSESMRLDTSGNMGVGTTTPGALLHVSGTSILQGAATTGSALNTVGLLTAAGGLTAVGITSSSTLNVAGALTAASTSIMSGAMTINSTLNVATSVGIGNVTTPSALLELRNATYVSPLLILDAGIPSTTIGAPRGIGQPLLRLGKISYSTTPGDYYGMSMGYAPDSTYYACTEIGTIITDKTGNETGDIVFSTRPNTTNIVATERLRINSNGLVGINTTAAAATLHVSGTSIISGSVTSGSTLNVAGALTAASTSIMSGAMTAGSTLNVAGAMTAGSTLNVAGVATINNTTNIAGDMNVTGNTIFNNSSGNTWQTAVNLNNNSSSAGYQFLVGGSGNSSANAGVGGFAIFGGLSGSQTFRLNINSNGNVGIGKTDPQALLHVSGTTIIGGAMTTSSTLNVVGGATMNSTMNVSGTATFNSNMIVGGSGLATFPLNVGGVGEQYTMTSSAKNQYFNSGTMVAIVPNNAITSNSAVLIDFGNFSTASGNTNAYMGSVSGAVSNGPSHLVFGRRTGVTSWSESMRLDTSGNMGIGTSGPSALLHVSGTSILQGAATSGSTLNTVGLLTAAGGLTAVGITSSSTLNVSGVTTLNNATITGTLSTNGAMNANNGITVSGGSILLSNSTMASSLTVSGAMTSVSTMNVSGVFTANNSSILVGVTTMNSSLYVSGTSAFMNSMAIGTTTATGLLTLNGTSLSLLGPHINVFNTGSTYPIYQQLNWSADNIAQNFDMYWDGSWRNSTTGWGYQTYKINNKLSFIGMNSGAAGSSGSTLNIMTMSGTNVGINNTNPLVTFHVSGATILGGSATIQSTLNISGNTIMNTAATASSSLNVAGAMTVVGSTVMNGAVSNTATLSVVGAITANSNLSVSGNTTIMGTANVGTNGVKGLLQSFNPTGTSQYHLTLTGAEFYQPSNTSADGVGLTAGVNRTGNRQLWVADTALAINTTNVAFRIMPSQGAMDAVSTDGTVGKVFTIGNSAGVIMTGSGTVGSNLNVTSNMNVGGTSVLVGAVSNNSTLYNTGAVSMGSSLTVSGTSILTSAVSVGSTLSVTGAATMNSSLNVVGNMRVNNIYPYADTLTSASTLSETINIVGHYINIGDSNSIINIQGTTTSVFTNEIVVEDPLIVVNSKASGVYNTLGNDAGIQIDAISSTGYLKTTTDGMKFAVKAPQSADIGYIVTKDNSDNLIITGTTTMKSSTTALSTLNISGATFMNSAATANSTLNVVGAMAAASTLVASGAVSMASTLSVTGAVTANSTMNVVGAFNAASTSILTNATTVGSTLNVNGAVTAASSLNVSGVATLSNKVVFNPTIGQAPASIGQIDTSNTVNFINPAAAVTGVTLLAGTTTGQMFMCVNRSAFDVTLDSTDATAYVANSINTILYAKTTVIFVWNATDALWYPTRDTY